MKTTLIQLERFDDVVSTRDKISWVKSSRVVLVWPRRGRILRNPLDLKLLDRTCHDCGAQLALVTRDRLVISNASQLGIPIFHSIDAAQKISWHRSQVQLKTGKISRNTPQDLNVLREKSKKGESFFEHPSLWVRWVSLLSGTAAFFVLLALFIPSASIKITMPTQEQKMNIPLRASPEILTPDLGGGIPAGSILTAVEGEKQAFPSGSLNLPAVSALGEVQFTNLTENEILIPAGTIVRTSLDPAVRFATTAAATAAAGIGETIIIPIQAVRPGLSGNLEVETINAVEGNLGLDLLVINLQPTMGGSDQSTSIATEADYEELRGELLNEMRQTATIQIEQMLSQDEQLLADSVQMETVLKEVRDPAVGIPSDQISLKLEAQFSGWKVQRSDIQKICISILDANLPDEYSSAADTLQMEEIGNPQWVNGQIVWNIEAVRLIRQTISDQAVLASISGIDIPDANRKLAQALGLEADPQIQVWPGFWPRLPYLTMRMDLELK